MRIVFVGGGTGGHFYPLIAVAEAILAHAKEQRLFVPELYYMGPEPYDEGSLFASGITFIKCPAGKMRRYASFKNVTDFGKTLVGICVAVWKLFVLYPDVVFSKGSYTSIPVLTAAWFLRIPVVIHESDTIPGRANRFGAKFAKYIAITYDDTIAHFPAEKTAKTGIPTRKELLLPPPKNARVLLGLETDKPLIFITGGSSGAERINDLIVSTLAELLPSYEIFHQVGAQNEKNVLDTARALLKNNPLLSQYHVRGFLDAVTLHRAESTADLIISRAGSTSIFEIALHGKPSILIPIPEEISHDQRTNAYAYARTGAAEVMEERNLSPHLLTAEITRIMNNPQISQKMSAAALTFGARDAAPRIAEALIAESLSHH
jgi:UDP-N-acetylglucosamine--N-acetylmuramyl-(pentapeptide) pyrophosphoryl-undecaprenol N-acetylglucosamine transferase